MFSLTLLLLNLALFLYLFVYGLCFLLLPFIRPLRASAPEEQSPASSSGEVCVLVPCHHEGPALIGTVSSLIEQDYSGALRAVILFQDSSDSSFEPLQKHFQFAWKPGQRSGVIFQGKNREVVLVCTEHKQKKDKLNAFLPKVHSKYLAFLDADHRAKSDWISQSIPLLQDGTHCGVQSRRAPLSLKKLPQLWDSAQNHIGNELVNVALQRVVGSVFFTGTTCVFLTESLRGRKFDDCVTEDTYLSYELLRDGETILYNPNSGSNEEVSPDFHSYVARRRRWSCGHNKVFFSLVSSILHSENSTRTKAAVLLHGLFYTVPVAVCLLLNVYALHLFVQYTTNFQILIAAIAVLISTAITLFMFGKHRSVIREILVLSFWIFPQITLAFPVVLYFMEHELYFFLTLFPYLRYIVWTHFFCLLAPLTLLLLGSRKIRVLQANQLILILLSYPLFFFLDLWACLLGFSDFLFGRPTWAKIQRTFAEDVLREENRGSSAWIIGRWAATAVALIFFVVSFNDLTADSNCGKADAYLFEPKLFVPSSEITWRLHENRTIKEKDLVTVSFESKFSKPLTAEMQIAHMVDGRFLSLTKGGDKNVETFLYEAPLGWEPHRYEAVFRSKGALCKRRQDFTTTVREFRDKKLFMNGEEFLVKGIIPSFSPAQKDMTPEMGLHQIKELGANTVRYYHALREEVKNAIIKNQLLVIDQPDRSTWNDINLSLVFYRLGLKQRFESLVSENRNFPYGLFHTLGNEIEILNPGKDIPYLIDIMKELIDEDLVDVFSYSTYYVYLRLPAAIYGVNMLDSSETYWKEGLKSLAALNKPFYASEFGGFVAFFEWTPPDLRIYRVQEYWKNVLASGAFGAVFHQSHDNWSQPVVEGFNDPLSADQPDDLRGLWDKDNREKSLIPFVENMYSDLEATVVPELVQQTEKSIILKIRNKRNYSLNDLQLFDGNLASGDKFLFLPGEEKEIVAPIMGARDGLLHLTARYTTHHGLAGVSQLNIRLPFQHRFPSVMNEDAIDIKDDENWAEGKLLRGGRFDFVAPSSWKQVRVFEQTIPVQPKRQSVVARQSMEDVVDLEGSTDGNTWRPIDKTKVGAGPQRVRFKLKRDYPSGANLILAGLGTDEYWIKLGVGEYKKSSCHRYRENLIPLDTLGLPRNEYVYLLLPRTKTVFISPVDHPQGKEVEILFETPKVYSPVPFRLEKVS